MIRVSSEAENGLGMGEGEEGKRRKIISDFNFLFPAEVCILKMLVSCQQGAHRIFSLYSGIKQATDRYRKVYWTGLVSFWLSQLPLGFLLCKWRRMPNVRFPKCQGGAIPTVSLLC